MQRSRLIAPLGLKGRRRHAHIHVLVRTSTRTAGRRDRSKLWECCISFSASPMRQLKGEPSTAPREPMAAEKKLGACVRVVGTATQRTRGGGSGGPEPKGDPVEKKKTRNKKPKENCVNPAEANKKGIASHGQARLRVPKLGGPRNGGNPFPHTAPSVRHDAYPRGREGAALSNRGHWP